MKIYFRELQTSDTSHFIPFIYNHTEMLYKKNNYTLIVETEDKTVYCGFHIEGKELFLQSWDVDFISQRLWNKCIKFLFTEFSIKTIHCHYSRFNFHNNLILDCNYYIPLPSTFDDLLNNMPKKLRYNRKRERRLLTDLGIHFEEIDYDEYELALKQFFNMKKKTHNRDWHLSPTDFLKTYNIDTVYALKNKNEEYVAVALSDEQFDTVCFQNFSYDTAYEKYSAGSVLYLFYLEKLIEKNIKGVHLGGGGHTYKEQYGSIKETTYNGCIERVWFWKSLYNAFMSFARIMKHRIMRIK